MIIDLDAIQARADAATEGPWEVDRNYPFTSDLVGIWAPDSKQYIVQVENQDDVDDPTTREDANFIAAARMDVPALLAYARDLEARLGRVETLANYLDRLASGDKHYAGLIRAALTATEGQA